MDPGQGEKGLALPTPCKTFVLSRWMSNYFEPQAYWETTARSNTRQFVGCYRAGRQGFRLVRTDLTPCWLPCRARLWKDNGVEHQLREVTLDILFKLLLAGRRDFKLVRTTLSHANSYAVQEKKCWK